jgi:inner membrane protein involved in colicin E2 resistance
MNRFKRYHRYFCRAILSVVYLSAMAFVLWGVFEHEDVRLIIGSIVGSVVTLIAVEHICDTAF